jgi:hypothetical protein
VRAAWKQDPGLSPVGGSDFVVLFPTTTTARRDSLAAVARETAGENAGRYWFTDNATLERWNVVDPHDPATNLILFLPWISGQREWLTLAEVCSTPSGRVPQSR